MYNSAFCNLFSRHSLELRLGLYCLDSPSVLGLPAERDESKDLNCINTLLRFSHGDVLAVPLELGKKLLVRHVVVSLHFFVDDVSQWIFHSRKITKTVKS